MLKRPILLRKSPARLALLIGGAILATTLAGAADMPAVADEASQAGPPTFRRLSEDQYKRSIAQIFGDDINVPGRFEPPVREEGLLAIGESHVVVTPSGLEQYALRAREISSQVLDEKHRAKFVTCPSQPAAEFNQACATQFFDNYGRQLLRRPLTAAERANVLRLAREAAAKSGDFYTGLGSGLGSLLVSPAFVFRMETTEADPAHPGARRLDAFSLATRISFLLWDAPPDEALLDAAADGSLHTEAGLDRQVDRMLASPRLEEGVRAFFADMLAYDQFAGLSKDAKLYPIFNPQLRDDAEEQSMRTIVDHLLVQNADYRDLFTTKKTYLSRSLGALYGVRVDARAFGGWMPYTFPVDSPVSGLLTFPAFLMLDPSHEGRSSPTIRGKMVRENLLCQTVPLPPANVDFNLVQDVNDPLHKTARDRLSAHNDSPICAGCHKITDPIGLSLENYTPVGSYRVEENGVTIDASGEFEGKTYNNGIELSKLLRNSPTAPNCVVQRVVEYGVGRKLSPGEEAWLEPLGQKFAQNGYRFRALLRQVATSPSFQAVAPTTLALNR
jgi:hypothetical protein